MGPCLCGDPYCSNCGDPKYDENYCPPPTQYGWYYRHEDDIVHVFRNAEDRKLYFTETGKPTPTLVEDDGHWRGPVPGLEDFVQCPICKGISHVTHALLGGDNFMVYQYRCINGHEFSEVS